MNQAKLVSFISPVCNQGNEARETVASARDAFGAVPHEIILIDDHSTDGSCHGLPQDVLIVRTDRREGVSSARRCGVMQARGDVLIWSDPHCRFPPGSLEHLSQLAASQDAIFQPRIAPNETSRVRSGGMLSLSERGLRVQRAYRNPAAFPALYGTVYAMKREVYERLGGWPKLPGIWSYSEQALTLTAWFLGVPIVVDTRFTCIHKSYHENNRFPFSVHRADIANNAHFVHAAFFPETYQVFWRPMLEKHFEPIHDENLLSSRDFERLRRHLKRNAIRSEAAFFRDVLQLDFPSAPAAPAVGYRRNAPRGEAYVRQQARRSKPQEYVTMRPRVDAALQWMASAFDEGHFAGKHAIDAGTRDGYGVCALLTHHGLGTAEGIELVPETAQHARQQGRSVRQGDMTAMPFDAKSADLITCIHALEHVPLPAEAVKEFARVLKPGGWLYLVVPEDESAAPENDATHNCFFPTPESLSQLVSGVELFENSSIRTNRGILASGRRELRFLVQRKN